MQMILKKFVSFVLLVTVMFSACGCGSDVKQAENAAKAYLTAVSSYNLDIMESALSEGTNKDFGVDVTKILNNDLQTNAQKQAAESMLKALFGTMGYTINSVEKTDRKTVVAGVTVQYAEVDQAMAMQHIQQEADAYVTRHPEIQTKTAPEQENIRITVMIQAYKTYLQTQNKTSRDVTITLVKKNGSWKILNGAENHDLVELFADLFGAS